MDKRTIIGIILIIVITLLMPFYQRWIVGDRQVRQVDTTRIQRDTIVAQPETTQTQTRTTPEKMPPVPPKTTIPDSTVRLPITNSPDKKIIEIENNVMRVKWSSEEGANPISWELKNYQSYKGGHVDLIDRNNLNINFLNIDGKEVNLNNYNFFTDSYHGKKIILNKQNPKAEIQFYLPVKNGRVKKTITFYFDKYSYDLQITFENLQQYIINRKYNLAWQGGLPPTEKNTGDDLNYTKAFTYMAEELEDLDASDEKYEKKDYNGRVDWVAVRTKYFLAAVIPSDPTKTNGSTIGGIKQGSDDSARELYKVAIDAPYEPRSHFSQNYTIYTGPLDYYILKKYDLDLQTLVMNNGWYERLFRPISANIIIPAFEFLHRFIPNYGLVIIVFSVLIKLILHPLTKKSYQSMSEMQFLQPKMQALREKYKNDTQRLNKEMMKLYKEHGVNPLGGCLPMLLQMPILVALFTVFRSTIQLRGEPFILWIKDLSLPDVLNIGIHLPLIGDNIHILPLLMGATMVWQSKMTMTDPKQKMMQYIMPVFLIFIFYSLPSGLNLYYAVFNLLSMIQTRQIRQKMHPDNQKESSRPAAAVQAARQNPKGKKRRK